jgi:hypothetical protein
VKLSHLEVYHQCICPNISNNCLRYPQLYTTEASANTSERDYDIPPPSSSPPREVAINFSKLSESHTRHNVRSIRISTSSPAPRLQRFHLTTHIIRRPAPHLPVAHKLPHTHVRTNLVPTMHTHIAIQLNRHDRNRPQVQLHRR